MSLLEYLKHLRQIYNEYPRQFWTLIVTMFIDRLGGALMFPFFTLYITRRFGVGMTEVGVIFGLFSIASVVGSMFGGALTDRLGRKGMLIFGLVASAAARFAPEEMRGRYMAVYGFSWVIPFTVGPLLAGLIMDNADPRWVWYAAGLIGVVAAGALALLQQQIGGPTEKTTQVTGMVA